MELHNKVFMKYLFLLVFSCYTISQAATTIISARPPLPIAAAGGGGGGVTLVQSSGAIIQDSVGSLTGSLNGVTAGNLVVLTVACSSSDSIALPTPAGWTAAEAPTASTAS